MIFFRKKNASEQEYILSSGEKIKIKPLSPAEQLHCLSLPGDISFCKRLSLGSVQPKLSFKKAKKLLNTNPFKALETVRAIQNISRKNDWQAQQKWQDLQDEQFLKILQEIEKLKHNDVPY